MASDDEDEFDLVDFDAEPVSDLAKYDPPKHERKKHKTTHLTDPLLKVHNYFLKQFACVNVLLCDNLSIRQVLNYNASDKVILPSNSFRDLANDSKESVYVLRLINPKNLKQVYVSIDGFTNSEKKNEKIMYIPPWIMKHLAVKNNEMVHADAVSVPKIIEVHIKVPEEVKRAEVNIKVILEFLLRNHTLLFIGKIISYTMFEREYQFEVTHLKPSHVGIILNSDVRLDLV
ncbi:MAG: putative ubiquitin fusion degradation protein [Hyperionvirus sp.]|uniref:Putative ubiquitin fusion degradation protein n=1 Tax=Hyperionvirus sp. TaxID=2487770 RepID=A0A3G5A970_9VIRU|nr:MAG: putative ubiquitin fusion degradation protein [Hyperionvirus sp.]